jgi:hypothetical protein
MLIGSVAPKRIPMKQKPLVNPTYRLWRNAIFIGLFALLIIFVAYTAATLWVK